MCTYNQLLQVLIQLQYVDFLIWDIVLPSAQARRLLHRNLRSSLQLAVTVTGRCQHSLSKILAPLCKTDTYLGTNTDIASYLFNFLREFLEHLRFTFENVICLTFSVWLFITLFFFACMFDLLSIFRNVSNFVNLKLNQHTSQAGKRFEESFDSK